MHHFIFNTLSNVFSKETYLCESGSEVKRRDRELEHETETQIYLGGSIKVAYKDSHYLRANISKATNCSICTSLGNSSIGNYSLPC